MKRETLRAEPLWAKPGTWNLKLAWRYPAIIAIDPIKQHILNAQKILVASHVSPDGDAIGSLMGLGWALRALGKDVTLACPTAPLPPSLTFVPGSEGIVSTLKGRFDLIILLDGSDLARMDKMYDAAVFAHTPLLNIDHHITNQRYGTVNWVEASAASAAEMVYALVRELGVPIGERIATALLTGITTDTLGFRTSSTTSQTLRIAADLMDAGASLPDIVEQAYNVKPLGVARVWGQALQNLQAEVGLVWTSVTRAMLQEYQVAEDEVKGLVGFLRGTQGTKIAVLFLENGNGKIKVEFRSSPQADVSAVATRLGGGGHRQASGCTIDGPLAAAQERVLAEVQQ